MPTTTQLWLNKESEGEQILSSHPARAWFDSSCKIQGSKPVSVRFPGWANRLRFSKPVEADAYCG